MNRTASACVLLCVALLSGCSMSIRANLYPVHGPLSEMLPVPVVQAIVEDVHRNTGPVSITLPDGEVCRGTWSSLAPKQVSVTSMSGHAVLSSALGSAYTVVYGTAYTVSNVPGVNQGTAYLIGERGTRIEVFFETGSGTANGSGVAVDTNGNTFKVIF